VAQRSVGGDAVEPAGEPHRAGKAPWRAGGAPSAHVSTMGAAPWPR
jgi:hypothetical protein